MLKPPQVCLGFFVPVKVLEVMHYKEKGQLEPDKDTGSKMFPSEWSTPCFKGRGIHHIHV